MNNFINRALTASLVFGLVIVVGVFSVFAESDNNVGIYISEAEINVYSPITDIFDCEINVNIQSLFEFVACDVTRIPVFDINCVQCNDVLFAEHQERVDKVIALICENSIDNLQELFVFLQTLQNEDDYVPIVPFGCSGGCIFLPVWVTINGVRNPGYRCINCGRVFILS